jgi:predicted nucleic acid-binding protein
MGKIEDALREIQGKKVYLDTNPFIYFINKVEIFSDLCVPIFQAIGNRKLLACSSEATLCELLVKPLREGDLNTAQHIKGFLYSQGYFQMLSHDRSIFELAANIRAVQNLKMIDALHAATAIKNDCNHFITADNNIAQRLKGILVLNLNDYIS